MTSPSASAQQPNAGASSGAHDSKTSCSAGKSSTCFCSLCFFYHGVDCSRTTGCSSGLQHSSSLTQDEDLGQYEDMGMEPDDAAQQGSCQFNVLERPLAQQYAGKLLAAFSYVPPRLWHAKGSAVKAATFGIPRYDPERKELDFQHFEQTGFGVIPGKMTTFRRHTDSSYTSLMKSPQPVIVVIKPFHVCDVLHDLCILFFVCRAQR